MFVTNAAGFQKPTHSGRFEQGWIKSLSRIIVQLSAQERNVARLHSRSILLLSNWSAVESRIYDFAVICAKALEKGWVGWSYGGEQKPSWYLGGFAHGFLDADRPCWGSVQGREYYSPHWSQHSLDDPNYQVEWVLIGNLCQPRIKNAPLLRDSDLRFFHWNSGLQVQRSWDSDVIRQAARFWWTLSISDQDFLHIMCQKAHKFYPAAKTDVIISLCLPIQPLDRAREQAFVVYPVNVEGPENWLKPAKLSGKVCVYNTLRLRVRRIRDWTTHPRQKPTLSS